MNQRRWLFVIGLNSLLQPGQEGLDSAAVIAAARHGIPVGGLELPAFCLQPQQIGSRLRRILPGCDGFVHFQFGDDLQQHLTDAAIGSAERHFTQRTVQRAVGYW